MSRGLYSRLLQLYPARFREEYERELERQFAEEYREASGGFGRAWFWIRALVDLATTIPAEMAREARQDLRFAARTYRHRKSITLLTVAALALAIGATTGVFSVLNALLLRDLPFAQPDRLVEFNGYPTNALHGKGVRTEDLGRYVPYFESAAVAQPAEMTLNTDTDGFHVKVAETSANFFAVLGTQPFLGRAFLPDEGQAGNAQVAVIGHGLWQEAFGADVGLLGRTVRVNGVSVRVIGIAPVAFDYPQRTAVWLPTIALPNAMPKPPGAYFLSQVARLKPGFSVNQARALFEADVRRVFPDLLKVNNPGRARLAPLRDQLAGNVRQASWVLLGTVLLVLLIACANVAQLFLSRVSERQGELSIRAALGASRARLTQQLVTEATVLTLVAAALGMGIAYWASRIATAAQPAALASQAYTILDWRVLGFAAGIVVVTGVMFGAFPLWALGRRMQPSHDVVRIPGRTISRRASRLRAFLVLAQAAFTVVLVACSVTTGRAFLRLAGSDLGYRTDHLVTMNIALAGTPYQENQALPQYFNAALQHIRAVPGVESAGAVNYLPLTDSGYMAGQLKLDGSDEIATGLQNRVTPGYFETMGIRLVAGRDFNSVDIKGAAPAIIVNEILANRLGGAQRLVGRTLRWQFTQTLSRPFTVVGVVGAAQRVPGLTLDGEFYVPIAQEPAGIGTLVARVRGDVNAYVPLLQRAVREADPAIPVYDIKTLDERLLDKLAKPRFYATAIAFLAGFALLLAAIGIYGVAANAVEHRTKEIGVRIAVGADRGAVRGMLLWQSLSPLAVGLSVGLVAALQSGQVLQHLISSVDPVGVEVLIVAAMVLLLAGFAAVWHATARVIRIDPITALRAD